MPSGNILCEWKNHENIPFIPLPDHQHMIFTLSNLLFSPIDKGPHLNAFKESPGFDSQNKNKGGLKEVVINCFPN